MNDQNQIGGHGIPQQQNPQAQNVARLPSLIANISRAVRTRTGMASVVLGGASVLLSLMGAFSTLQFVRWIPAVLATMSAGLFGVTLLTPSEAAEPNSEVAEPNNGNSVYEFTLPMESGINDKRFSVYDSIAADTRLNATMDMENDKIIITAEEGFPLESGRIFFVYGETVYSLDLTVYRDEIVAAVLEDMTEMNIFTFRLSEDSNIEARGIKIYSTHERSSELDATMDIKEKYITIKQNEYFPLKSGDFYCMIDDMPYSLELNVVHEFGHKVGSATLIKASDSEQ
jgi:hypothetical protein